MDTIILTTSIDDIDKAAGIIKRGGIVAFPTETVYGLGANALDAKAVRRVYEAKGRPTDNPSIVHIACGRDMERLTPQVSELARSLGDRFWPGPLTMVVDKKQEVPDETTGGLSTVAVRSPDEVTAIELIRRAGCPIAAPSANLSGKPSPTKAAHVLADLTGRADAIIIGPDCRVGIESTVVDVTGETPVILRPGIVTAFDIEAATGRPVALDPSLFLRENDFGDGVKPKSPGMKYKHYAPKAKMTVFEGPAEKVKGEIERVKALREADGYRVGVILFDEQATGEAARELFARLRELDGQGADLILAGAVPEQDGVGFAVMNRMLKAAGYNVIKV